MNHLKKLSSTINEFKDQPDDLEKLNNDYVLLSNRRYTVEQIIDQYQRYIYTNYYFISDIGFLEIKENILELQLELKELILRIYVQRQKILSAKRY